MPYMRLSDIYGPCTSGICRIVANHTQIHPGTTTRSTASNRATTGLTGSQLPTTLACGMATHGAQREIHRNLAGPTTSRSAVTEDMLIMLMKLLVQKKVGSCSISSLSPHKLFQRSQKIAKALVSPTAQSMCRRWEKRVIQKRTDTKWKYQEILIEIWEYLGKCHIYLNLSTTI